MCGKNIRQGKTGSLEEQLFAGFSLEAVFARRLTPNLVHGRQIPS
jgi:hypothetical protein